MKVVAVIPAYNAAKMIVEVIARIPPGLLEEIMVLDDCSSDNTFGVLSTLPGITVLRHNKNRGYGGALITLYKAAQDIGADIIISMHADGGHFPEEIPLLLAPIQDGRAEVVIGSRIAGILQNSPRILGSRYLGALVYGPMPSLRFVGHIGLRAVHNFFFHAHFQAWNCGFRAVTSNVLDILNVKGFDDGYLFDPEFLLAAYKANLQIEEVPVSSYYDPRVESANEPFSYGIKALWFTISRVLSTRFTSKHDDES